MDDIHDYINKINCDFTINRCYGDTENNNNDAIEQNNDIIVQNDDEIEQSNDIIVQNDVINQESNGFRLIFKFLIGAGIGVSSAMALYFCIKYKKTKEMNSELVKLANELTKKNNDNEILSYIAAFFLEYHFSPNFKSNIDYLGKEFQRCMKRLFEAFLHNL